MGHSEFARLKERKIMRRCSTFRSLGNILVTEIPYLEMVKAFRDETGTDSKLKVRAFPLDSGHKANRQHRQK